MKYKNYEIDIEMPVLCIHDFYIEEEINHHTVLFLKGIYKENEKDEHILRLYEGSKVEVKENGRPIFCGLLHRIQMYSQGQVSLFELYAYSYSFQMDIEKKRRSFQCLEDTYEQIAEKIMSAYVNGNVHYAAENKQLPHMLLQYEETDWEFLIRLASHQAGYLCINSSASYPDIKVTAGNEIPGKLLQSENYEIRKDIGKNLPFAGEDVTYIVESTERISAGSAVTFRKKELIVRKSETIVRKEEICCRLYLTHFMNIRTIKLENKELYGLRLEAIVKEVKRNQLKVHFLIDQEFSGQGYPYIDYAGGVNNELGYCMPQPGDRTVVSFSGPEETGIVTDMVRNKENPVILADSPKEKYFCNEKQKGMYLRPSEFMLSDGMSNTKIYLTENGRALLSAPGSIAVKSNGNLILGDQGPKRISIQAGSSVSFKTGTSSIKLNQTGNISCKAENGVKCTGKPGQLQGGCEYEVPADGLSGVQGALMSVASVEFVSQAISGRSSYSDSAGLLGDMFGTPMNLPLPEGQSSLNYNPIQDGMLGGEEGLFRVISYGESLNGEE